MGLLCYITWNKKKSIDNDFFYGTMIVTVITCYIKFI